VPRSLSLRQLFEFSDLLVPLRPLYDTFFNDFQAYKGQIPTYGCILLNAQLDRMVLVCNWKVGWGGWHASSKTIDFFVWVWVFFFGRSFATSCLGRAQGGSRAPARLPNNYGTGKAGQQALAHPARTLADLNTPSFIV
jgi:hypothetical protein